MLQKKYVFHTIPEMENVVSAITESAAYEEAAGVLLQLYNPKIDAVDDKIVAYIRQKCRKGCLVGITCANIADKDFDIKDNPIELNVTFFKTTRLLAFEFDMSQKSGFVAGRNINDQLQIIPDARCLLVCYACGSSVIHAFTEEFRHHKLPIFGARAGRSIRALNTAKVYGTRALANGIVAIILAGADLRLYMDNCLGFREIGLEMMVTQMEGDNVIQAIDDKPAVEIYSKYLRVQPNEYFVHNVCEFPLIFHRHDCLVARVPAAYGEDGSIHFTADISKGETFRLSYGNPDNLFQITDNSARKLQAFHPEAVFLFECGNRVRFLKERAREGIDNFRKQAAELSVAVGYAELFFSAGDGGVLNSALVVVGLTENPQAQDEIRPFIDFSKEDSGLQEQRDYIPFVDRILHFLSTTSSELDKLNRELGKIAYTDQLTRIYNRWELENKLEEMLKHRAREQMPMSLLFMDIDHFKRVNDTYGHDVGDLVLRATVDLIKDSLQPQHVFGRWGGEEFLYALPGVELAEAQAFAEKLRRRIEANCYVVVRHVTMSFGVTSAMADDTLDSLIKRADKALYMAKENGRNQVVGIE